MKFRINKKLVMVILVLVLFLSLFGGSLAYLSWDTDNSQRTMVSVTLPGATLTISGGKIYDTVMYSTAYCSGDGALVGGDITATAVNTSELDMEVILKLRASLKSKHGTITDDMKSHLHWAVVDTSTSDTCETTPYKGTFEGVTTNTDIDPGINYIATANGTTNRYYRLYVWLDSTYEHINYGSDITDPMEDLYVELSFSPISEMLQMSVNSSSQPAAPVLDSGMIPVKISADGVVTTVSNTDPSWYNYSNKEWANVVLVKNSGTQTRSYYKSNVGVTVAEDDILAYYVWIPRYKYKIWTLTESSTGSEQTIDIVFESVDEPVTQGSQVGDYITHSAFVWDGNPVSGIWVGKFETSHSTLSGSTTANNLGCSNENCANADGLTIKPDVVSLRNNNVSNFFFASRSMTRSGNPFGFSSSTTDTHMMKNSEWGAVTYLSHSKYGINSEIYVNNSSGYYTGRSGGDVGGSVKNNYTLFGQGPTGVYSSTLGYYTWIGQSIDLTGVIGGYASDRTLGTKASTTGNVCGIYDMSGGAYEYVMGVFSDSQGNPISGSSFNSNSGFYGLVYEEEEYFSGVSVPNTKYYDLYLNSQFTGNYNNNITLCTFDSCGGHALNETLGWYSDAKEFVDFEHPWFTRGGNVTSNIYADLGQWNSLAFDGSSTSRISFRVVVIVQ